MMLVVTGRSESGTEERVLGWLKSWTGDYKIPGIAITNVYVAGQEVDLVVITPYTIVAIEIKGTAPAAPRNGVLICTSNSPWQIPGFAGDPVFVRATDTTPYDQVRKAALKLKRMVGAAGSAMYVPGLVLVVPPRGSELQLEKKSAPDGCHVLLCKNHNPLRAWFHHAHRTGGVACTADQAHAVIDALECGDRVTVAELEAEGFPRTQSGPLPPPPPISRPAPPRPAPPVFSQASVPTLPPVPQSERAGPVQPSLSVVPLPERVEPVVAPEPVVPPVPQSGPVGSIAADQPQWGRSVAPQPGVPQSEWAGPVVTPLPEVSQSGRGGPVVTPQPVVPPVTWSKPIRSAAPQRHVVARAAPASAAKRSVFQTVAAFAAIAVLGAGLWLLARSGGEPDPTPVQNDRPISSVADKPEQDFSPAPVEAPPSVPAGETCFPFQPNC